MRPVRRRGDRGSSAIEILMAMILFFGVGAMTVAVMRVARYEVDLATRTHQQQDLRSSMNRAMQQLRNSRPLGVCYAPAGANVNQCQRIGERPFTLISATPSEVCFYAHDDLNPDPLQQPDRVCVREHPTANALVVATREGTGNYTNQSWSAQEVIRRIGTIDKAQSRFRYYVFGSNTPRNSLTSTADLQNVSLIELTVQVTGDGLVQDEITNRLTFQAAPRGSRLQREQSFEEL